MLPLELGKGFFRMDVGAFPGSNGIYFKDPFSSCPSIVLLAEFALELTMMG
jgi:hypothetical protein